MEGVAAIWCPVDILNSPVQGSLCEEVVLRARYKYGFFLPIMGFAAMHTPYRG